MTFRSILCPVDFSLHSRQAVQYAGALAGRFAGELTVMFVNDPLLAAAAAKAYGGRERFLDRTEAELQRFVDKALPRGARRSAGISFVVSVGNPADEILRQAKQRRSDLVVIGTHGLSGFQKLFFGSTTQQVLHDATVPILAIPPARGRRRSTPPTSFERVLAPIDLAGEWQSDAVHAAAIARLFDAELVLVHVLAEIQTPPWIPSPEAAGDDRRREKASRALERARAKLGADVRSTSLVLMGNPAEEIARQTSGGPSLVVMSLRGTTSVWGRRGSIAYHVLTHASAPLLALPRRRLGGRLAVRARRALHQSLNARDRAELAGIDALLSAGSAGKTRRR